MISDCCNKCLIGPLIRRHMSTRYHVGVFPIFSSSSFFSHDLSWYSEQFGDTE